MSHSLQSPALHPPERVLVALADYGPEGGGWGPITTVLFGYPIPFFYTNDATIVLATAHDLAKRVADEQGREARVSRFTKREDLGVYLPA